MFPRARVRTEAQTLEVFGISTIQARPELHRKVVVPGLVVAPENVPGANPEPAISVKQRIGPEPAANANQQWGNPLVAADKFACLDDLHRRVFAVKGVIPDDHHLQPDGGRQTAGGQASPPRCKRDVKRGHHRDQAQQHQSLRQVFAVP